MAQSIVSISKHANCGACIVAYMCYFVCGCPAEVHTGKVEYKSGCSISQSTRGVCTTTIQALSQHSASLSDPNLPRVASLLVSSGLAPNTARQYNKQQEGWLGWAAQHGVNGLHPTTHDLALFTAHLYSRSLAAST